MDTLQTVSTVPSAPSCTFSISPLGPPFSYSVGGTTFTPVNSHQVFSGVNLTFTGQVTVPPGVFIVEYYWNFGDGSEAYGVNTSHTYNVGAAETRVSFCITDNFKRQICSGKLLNLRPGLAITVGAYIVRGH